MDVYNTELPDIYKEQRKAINAVKKEVILALLFPVIRYHRRQTDWRKHLAYYMGVAYCLLGCIVSILYQEYVALGMYLIVGYIILKIKGEIIR